MHIVHGELRKATYIKSGVGKDGQSTMFGIELSEMIKDYKTGEKTYTNYKAILFASSPAHVDYYNSALVEGNFVVVNCEKLKIEVSECGQYTKLFMDNARLEGSGYIAQGQVSQSNGNQGQQQQQQQQQQKPAQQQGGFSNQPAQQGGFANQGQQQKAPQQQGGFANQGQQQAPSTDFDDDIPFAPIGLAHNNSLIHVI